MEELQKILEAEECPKCGGRLEKTHTSGTMDFIDEFLMEGDPFTVWDDKGDRGCFEYKCSSECGERFYVFQTSGGDWTL